MENNKDNDQEKSNDVELNWDADPNKTSPSEGLKKLLSAGLSVVMMSEESVREYLKEVKMPKDALGNVMKSVGKSKEEIIGKIGSEFTKLIEKIDVVDELTKFLRENKIKVSAEIEFFKKDKNSSEQ
jgi:hypothetical protein